MQTRVAIQGEIQLVCHMPTMPEEGKCEAMTLCRVCRVTLVPSENWGPHNMRNNRRICKPCTNIYNKERYAASATVPLARKLNEHCWTCGVLLVSGINWYQSLERINSKACKSCRNDKTERWTNGHPNQTKAITKKYRKAHLEQCKTASKKWADAHPEVNRVSAKEWNKTHPEQYKATGKRWWKTPKGKLARIRHNLRRRNFPPLKTILGKWFPGAHLHHMTWETGIWVPRELHRCIPHCLETGKNMDKINIIVMDWFERGGPMIK